MSKASTQEPLPILVVGAGPVGMTLAAELSRYGAPVRIIDQRRSPPDVSPAIGIHARTLEYLETMGILDRFLKQGLEIRQINIHVDGKRAAQIKLDHINSPFPFALNIPQAQTEAILSDHLAKLGITIERGTELIALANKESSIQTLVRGPDGKEARIDAAYIVGCDGANSVVRQQADIPFDGSDDGDAFVLADVSLAGSFETNSWHIFLHDNGMFLLFPLPNDRWRIITNLKHQPSQSPDLEFFQKLMNERKVPPTALTECHWTSSFTVRQRIAPLYRKGRVLLAGDAAHIHSPAGGQGMNIGMQDSINLAWKLAWVTSGRSAESLLDSYHEERSKVGSETLAMTNRLTQIATPRSSMAIRLRNVMLPFLSGLEFVQFRIVDSLEEMSANYRGTNMLDDAVGISDRSFTPPLFRSGGLVPGDRAPDGTVTSAIDGKALRLFSAFANRRFTLLIFVNRTTGKETLDAIANILRNVASLPPDTVQTILISGRKKPDGLAEFQHLIHFDARGFVHKQYNAASTASLYLVRPDGYVSFRAIPPQWLPLKSHLDSYLLQPQPDGTTSP